MCPPAQPAVHRPEGHPCFGWHMCDLEKPLGQLSSCFPCPSHGAPGWRPATGLGSLCFHLLRVLGGTSWSLLGRLTTGTSSTPKARGWPPKARGWRTGRQSTATPRVPSREAGCSQGHMAGKLGHLSLAISPSASLPRDTGVPKALSTAPKSFHYMGPPYKAPKLEPRRGLLR